METIKIKDPYGIPFLPPFIGIYHAVSESLECQWFKRAPLLIINFGNKPSHLKMTDNLDICTHFAELLT